MAGGSLLLGTNPGSNLLGGDVTSDGGGSSYTFQNGLTLTGSIVTNDLNTGKAGGQTATGGTGSGDDLTLRSTSHLTKGQIFFGAGGLSWFNEANEGGGVEFDSQFVIGATTTYATLEFRTAGVQRGWLEATQFGNLSLIATGSGGVSIFGGGPVLAAQFTNNGNTLIGTNVENATTRLKVRATTSVTSAAGAVWDGIRFDASTLTLVGTTTVTELAAARFQVPTMTDASACEVTDASTVTIDGAPTNAGSVTFGTADSASGAKALWIKAGIARFDGGIKLKGTTTIESVGASLNLTAGAGDVVLTPIGGGTVQFGAAASFAANAAVATTLGSVGPTGASTTVQQWLKIKNSGGTTRYIPCW